MSGYCLDTSSTGTASVSEIDFDYIACVLEEPRMNQDGMMMMKYN